MWLKVFFGVLVLLCLVMIWVALWSPQHRRAVHETFVLLAKIMLIVAIMGATIAYFKRHY